MLRYDACYPGDAEAVTMLSHLAKQKRMVTVKRVVTTKTQPWTEGRWASFGWQLKELYARKI